MRKILSILALCLCAFVNVLAQTQEESEMYDKTVKKPNVRSLEKFLEKYPESVYTQDVVRLRDSVLFSMVNQEDVNAVRMFSIMHPGTPLQRQVDDVIRRLCLSGISREEARRIAGADEESMNVVGWKMDDGEYVAKVSIMLDGSIVVTTYTEGGVKACRDKTVTRYELGTVAKTRLVDSLSVVHMKHHNFLAFSYVNECTDGGMEYVQVLYDYRHDIANNAVFFGKGLLKNPAKGEYKIEGRSLNTVSGGIVSEEQKWPMERVKENPLLVPLSETDLLTDRSIDWWLSKNPNAQTTATKLSFGTLDKNCSLLEAYKKAKIVKGEKFNAAIVDFRGYTSVVVYSKTTGNHQLVWCEPMCKNKDTDRLLNTVYFERGTSTLVLFYYEGRTTFKYKVSLADKSIRR